jgi:hypothetical protein
LEFFDIVFLKFVIWCPVSIKYQQMNKTLYLREREREREREIKWSRVPVAHAYNPTTQEAEIRRITVWSQPWAQFLRPYLENTQHKTGWRSGSCGRMPTEQARGTEFKPQYCQKEINQKILTSEKEELLFIV